MKFTRSNSNVTLQGCINRLEKIYSWYIEQNGGPESLPATAEIITDDIAKLRDFVSRHAVKG